MARFTYSEEEGIEMVGGGGAMGVVTPGSDGNEVGGDLDEVVRGGATDTSAPTPNTSQRGWLAWLVTCFVTKGFAFMQVAIRHRDAICAFVALVINFMDSYFSFHTFLKENLLDNQVVYAIYFWGKLFLFIQSVETLASCAYRPYKEWKVRMIAELLTGD